MPPSPRLKTSMLGEFRHYRNLGKTEARLRALLRDFEFNTMVSVLAEHDARLIEEAAVAPLPYVW